jgi:hypothetical protein
MSRHEPTRVIRIDGGFVLDDGTPGEVLTRQAGSVHDARLG